MARQGKIYSLVEYEKKFRFNDESRWAFIIRKQKEGLFEGKSIHQVNRDFGNPERFIVVVYANGENYYKERV